MFSTDDSIVAIATPPGRGGLGVVRLSGPAAFTIAESMTASRSPFEPRHATFTRVRADMGALDEVVATFFKAPHSYTGQDVVEISAHGSPVVLQAIVRLAIDAGARLAEPGEFTLRAFLNGKRDLIQAEALPQLSNLAESDRLPRLRKLFQTTYSSDHKLRQALYRLGALDLVRTIEGKA